MQEKLLSIIIVNWNSSNLLNKCLDLIIKNTRLSFEIFIIDNASSDNFNTIIDKYSYRSNIKIIKNKKNIGALGLNKLNGQTHGKHIAIVSPDINVLPNCLDLIINFIDRQKDAGIVIPQLLTPEGRPQEYIGQEMSFKRHFFAMDTIIGHIMRQVFNIYPKKEHPRKKISKGIFEVDDCAGACMVINGNWYKKQVKLIDENFPFYFGDGDICKRVHLDGYKIYLLEEAKAVHLRGSSFKKRKFVWREKEYQECMVKYIKKHRRQELLPIKILIIFDRFLKIPLFFFSRAVVQKNGQLTFKDQIDLFINSLKIAFY